MKRIGTLISGLGLSFAVALFVGCSKENEAAHPHEGGHQADGSHHGEVETTTYPLKTCVVSGEELGSMGKPVSLTYKGQEVKFCCSGCIDDFNASAEKYLAKLSAAQAGK